MKERMTFKSQDANALGPRAIMNVFSVSRLYFQGHVLIYNTRQQLQLAGL